MLVLSRTLGEEIVIGENIVVSVVAVRNGRVRLGISAPREVPVMRREVQTKIQEQEASLRAKIMATC